MLAGPNSKSQTLGRKIVGKMRSFSEKNAKLTTSGKKNALQKFKQNAQKGAFSAQRQISPKIVKQSYVPSHIVEPKMENNFTQRHIDLDNVPKTDFTAVFQISHDLRIGFNRFDMFTERFERQKKVVQNNNFKLMCGKGPAREDRKTLMRQKKEAMGQQIKDKRMIHALNRLREIGDNLSSSQLASDYVDGELIGRFVERLQKSIRIQNEKLNGVPEQARVEKKTATPNNQDSTKPEIEQASPPPPAKPIAEKAATTTTQSPSQNNQRRKSIKNSVLKLENAPNQTTNVAEKVSSNGLTSLEDFALKKYLEEQEADRKIVEELMDPKNNLQDKTKDEFQALLDRENVFQGVTNRIFILHNERNKQQNNMYPLMVKMETSQQQVKYVLKDIDQSSFLELRDLKKTPTQLASRKLQKLANTQYTVVDDLREKLGNENLKQSRFCGILNRLINQQAEELGCLTKGYEKFYMEEIRKHREEQPLEEKCIKSLLSKQNILKHQCDQALAKKLIKQAKIKQAEQQLNGTLNGAEVEDRFSKSNFQGARVKTFEELNAAKEAALRKMREKTARERQTVLDNLHLLRLREMYPDAKIECSEHIQNLIEAYMRRNMVATELKEELALAKLLEKKPRPFEIIQGFAVMRPQRCEFLPGYQKMKNKGEKKSPIFHDDSSCDATQEEGKNNKIESVDQPKTQTLSVYIDGAAQLETSQKSKLQPQISFDSGGNASPFSTTTKTMKMKEPIASIGSSDYMQAISKIEDSQVLQAESKQDDDLMRDKYAVGANDDVMVMVNAELPGNIASARSVLPHYKSKPLRQSYLAAASISGAQDIEAVHHDDQGYELSSIREDIGKNMPTRTLDNIATYATSQGEDASRQSVLHLNLTPTAQLGKFMNDERHVFGIFQQRSETFPTQDNRYNQTDNNQNGQQKFSERNRKKLKDRQAALKLELGNIRSKSNREMRFMSRVCNDAANRRNTKGDFCLTLTGLKNSDQQPYVGYNNQRNIYSARTKDGTYHLQESPDYVNSSGQNTQFDSSLVNRNLNNFKQNDAVNRVFSNATTSLSCLNSQQDAGSTKNAYIRMKNYTPNLEDHNFLSQKDNEQPYQHLETLAFTQAAEDITLNSFKTEAVERASLTVNPKISYQNLIKQNLALNPDILARDDSSINTNNIFALQTNKKNLQTAQNMPKREASYHEEGFQASQIKSYLMPLSTNSQSKIKCNIPQKVSAEVTQTSNEIPITALQKRFPQRDASNFLLKSKRQDASQQNLMHNVPIMNKTIAGPTTSRLGTRVDRIGTPEMLPQAQTLRFGKRPFTGIARHQQKIIQDNMPGISHVNSNQPKKLDIRDLKYQNYSQVLDHAVTKQNKMNNFQSSDEQEFCDLSESQLPDGILAFMELNDLPVFIDKKIHQTIKVKDLNKSNSGTASVFFPPARSMVQRQARGLLNKFGKQNGAQYKAIQPQQLTIEPQEQTLLHGLKTFATTKLNTLAPNPSYQQTTTHQMRKTKDQISSIFQETSPQKFILGQQPQLYKDHPSSASSASHPQSSRRRIIFKHNQENHLNTNETQFRKESNTFRNKSLSINNIAADQGNQINQDLDKELNGTLKLNQNLLLPSETNLESQRSSKLPKPLFQKSCSSKYANQKQKHPRNDVNGDMRKTQSKEGHQTRPLSGQHSSIRERNCSHLASPQGSELITPKDSFIQMDAVIQSQDQELLGSENPMRRYMENPAVIGVAPIKNNKRSQFKNQQYE